MRHSEHHQNHERTQVFYSVSISLQDTQPFPLVSDSGALGALEEWEALDPLGPPRSDLGWGWDAARGLTQCVEVYTMAGLRGRADSSIWPLTPACGPARTEGGP